VADASLAIHKAVLSALSAGLSCEAYDAVPQGAAYPYAVIDSVAAGHEDPLDRSVERRVVYLSFWSRTRGQKEVLDLMSQADAALHRTKLPLDSGRIVSAAVTRKNTSREPDNETFMGSMSVEYLVEP